MESNLDTDKKSSSAEKGGARERMKMYWQVFEPTIESMMLSSDAPHIAEKEVLEVIAYLPPFGGKRVLELGSGIGRYTSHFAPEASHVTAVDFMEAYIKENERRNAAFTNISYLCADVTTLDFPEESFDFVFSNWLLMYLTDEEVQSLLQNIIKWLSPNGYLFIRESCYHPSGNKRRENNPTNYRSPMDYFTFLAQASAPSGRFSTLRAGSVFAYIQRHSNPNQLYFLVQKQPLSTKNMLEELTKAKNSVGFLYRQNKVLGKGAFIPGGEEAVINAGRLLSLGSGKNVLVLGCEFGNIPSILCRNFEVFVHGMTDEPGHFHVAIERQGREERETKQKMQFEMNDMCLSSAPTEAYEAVLIFNVLPKVSHLSNFISNVQRVLKYGGQGLIWTLSESGISSQVPQRLIKKHCEHMNLILRNPSEITMQMMNHGLDIQSSLDVSDEFITNLEDNTQKMQDDIMMRDLEDLAYIRREMDLLKDGHLSYNQIIFTKDI